jgi:hypothetical protein
MCFKLLFINNINYNTQWINSNYFFFYNKSNFLIKNNPFFNFFKINWFKNKILFLNTQIFFLKIKTSKLFFFSLNNKNSFNYFLKIKHINFYNSNKNIINKEYFFILKLHSYFFKYFFFLTLNIKHFLFFNINSKHLFKSNKNLFFIDYSNNLSLFVNKNLRKKTIKNLLLFNEML